MQFSVENKLELIFKFQIIIDNSNLFIEISWIIIIECAIYEIVQSERSYTFF